MPNSHRRGHLAEAQSQPSQAQYACVVVVVEYTAPRQFGDRRQPAGPSRGLARAPSSIAATTAASSAAANSESNIHSIMPRRPDKNTQLPIGSPLGVRGPPTTDGRAAPTTVRLGRLRSAGRAGTASRTCARPGRSGAAPDVSAAEAGDGRLHTGLAGQLTHIGHLLIEHQRHHRAVGPGASGPARPVQVRLVFHGRIGVNNESHVVDVDAARGDVRCDQHPGRTIGEGREVAGTGVLGQVAVQLDRRHAPRIQLTGKILGAVLGAREDDLPARRRGEVGKTLTRAALSTCRT